MIYVLILCLLVSFSVSQQCISYPFFLDHQEAHQSQGDAVREVQHLSVTQLLLLLKH